MSWKIRRAPARPMTMALIWLETWLTLPENCLVMFRKGTTMLMLKAMPDTLTLGAPERSSTPPTRATIT